MNSVVVINAEIATALGDMETTWQGILAGRQGVKPYPQNGFAEPWPLGMAADLPLPLGTNERLQALLAKLLRNIPPLPPNTALFCATTKGAVDELLACPEGPWPGQPADLGDSLAQQLGLSGHHMVSGACASGTLALIQASMRLAAGECETALVIGVDILSRFVLAGFASLQGLSATGCRPFDLSRDGLSLGEGGGWLLLTTQEVAARKHWPVLARLAGYGLSCDATHITGPCRQASGLIRALRQATEDGKNPVGGVNAHGTGTLYNDSMELLAFSRLWQEPPPIHSIKGAVGHCLGAAGVIEAALAIRSLHEGILLPTVGLREPESDSIPISGTEALPLRHPSVLSCNSGFGGINAAALFGKP